jgi:chemotaxis regulatin CheY-phosphate phosphatase CheZ
MSNDLMKRLHDLRHQRHHQFYVNHCVADAIQRIEELEAKAMDNFQMYVDANEARLDAEAKLAKGLKAVERLWDDWFVRDLVSSDFYGTLAALKGETDD